MATNFDNSESEFYMKKLEKDNKLNGMPIDMLQHCYKKQLIFDKNQRKQFYHKIFDTEDSDMIAIIMLNYYNHYYIELYFLIIGSQNFKTLKLKTIKNCLKGY